MLVGVVVWNALVAQAREYVLTDRRILRGAGVFQRIVTDLPLTSIQHIELTRLVRERVFGLGSIGFNTAGTAWTEAYWVMIGSLIVAATAYFLSRRGGGRPSAGQKRWRGQPMDLSGPSLPNRIKAFIKGRKRA